MKIKLFSHTIESNKFTPIRKGGKLRLLPYIDVAFMDITPIEDNNKLYLLGFEVGWLSWMIIDIVFILKKYNQ